MIVELIDVEPFQGEFMMATLDVTKDGVTTRTAYFMARDILEWRIAEYDLDPADTETLIDLVLHEQHLDIPEAAGLFRAATIAEARTTLLDALKAKKAEGDQELGAAKRAAGKDREAKARKKIVDLSLVDPAIIADKKVLVAHHREGLKAEAAAAAAAPAAPAADRGKALRNVLEAMKSAGTDVHPKA